MLYNARSLHGSRRGQSRINQVVLSLNLNQEKDVIQRHPLPVGFAVQTPSCHSCHIESQVLEGCVHEFHMLSTISTFGWHDVQKPLNRQVWWRLIHVCTHVAEYEPGHVLLVEEVKALLIWTKAQLARNAQVFKITRKLIVIHRCADWPGSNCGQDFEACFAGVTKSLKHFVYSACQKELDFLWFF